MPTINFPSSPASGQIYSYNGRTWTWNGYAWDSSITIVDDEIKVIIEGGAEYLRELKDVNIYDPYVGQVLVYDGNLWVNDYVTAVDDGTGGVIEVWENPALTTATDVSGIPAGSNLVGLNSIQILEDMLYVYQPINITAFSIGLAPSFEIGQTAGAGNYTATWSATNNSNIVSNGMSITYSGVSSGTLIASQPYSAGTGGGLSITHGSYSSSTVGTTLTFTLTADQTIGADDTLNATPIRWWSRMHHGKSTNASLTTFMGSTLSFGGNRLISSSSFGTYSLSFTAGSGYAYVFVHNDYSITSFIIGATDVTSTFQLLFTQTIVNSYGASAVYKVYRSTNQLNGDFTLTVS